MPANKLPFEDISTPMRAIKAECVECVNGPTSLDDLATIEPVTFKSGVTQGYREEIKHCLVTTCALYNFRPWKAK